VKTPQRLTESVRFDIADRDLCPALTWKGQFTGAKLDPSVQSTRDHQYWCVFTQTCIGPDNGLVEPHLCSVKNRACRRDAVRSLIKNR